MLLTLTTTNKPATDMGYLLHKSPFRTQASNLPFGKVYIFYPEASEEKCTLAILMDVDPVDLVRNSRNPQSTMPLEQYVNDRPYVCSSYLSVIFSRVFGQTLHGKCSKRPDLVDTIMPLTCRLSVIPCRGGEQLLRRLFEPLGYAVKATRHTLDKNFPDWGDSSYHTVELQKDTTVKDLFNHLYVLVPVLDNQKHYYVDKSEIDKLLIHGEGWLKNHPEKENIAQRYLKHRVSYTSEALERLIDVNPAEQDDIDIQVKTPEDDVEKGMNLNEERLGTVLSILKSVNAESVLDLGCGEGSLLRLLIKEKQFKRLVGLDVSIRALEKASDRLNIKDLPPTLKEKIHLFHGSLMYRDRRLQGFDAATIIEVIEHLDEPRLRAFERVVFEFAQPKTIIVTTPNREYNVTWENIGPSKFRHGDHRFEWTRTEFSQWSNQMAQKYNYQVRFISIGPEMKEIGSPTQTAIFSKYVL